MTAKSASLSPAKEENSLLPGSAEKPADVYIPGWSNGCDAAFDVSVVSPLQTQLINKAADEIGSAAIKRFNEKKNKYNTACENEGIKFFPLIVETFGGWHAESEIVLTKLGRQLASYTGNVSDDTVRHFYQRLGILLARGNASLINHRNPNHADAIVDGDQDF